MFSNAVPPDESSYVNNWTLVFDLDLDDIRDYKTATLTVQLAASKTGTKNLEWLDLPYKMNVNGQDAATYVIPASRTSSCAFQTAVSCFN